MSENDKKLFLFRTLMFWLFWIFVANDQVGVISWGSLLIAALAALLSAFFWWVESGNQVSPNTKLHILRAGLVWIFWTAGNASMFSWQSIATLGIAFAFSFFIQYIDDKG